MFQQCWNLLVSLWIFLPSYILLFCNTLVIEKLKLFLLISTIAILIYFYALILFYCLGQYQLPHKNSFRV
ncbi:hypothetical protein D0Y65_020905 [Glycine soja]|uniref:Uncharacterized protein n=1 Tax=Glycine soja TaxID=3848 RepID=A0A445JGB1_GLYSO|nr:hypothetical protein D0Y65_020905 [Glycine soja]